jgi:multidrug resistance protein, MATE family
LRSCLSQLFPLSASLTKRLLHVGAPAAMQRISWAASVFVLFFILAQLPESTAALASWTIGMRVEGLLFMPLMALSLAVGSIIGQNIGAKRLDRAFQAGWTVTNIGVALMIVLGLALFMGADALAALMSRDPKTIEFTANYLRINAVAEPLLAVNMILSGGLQGAGDTRITMWVSLFTNWIIRLPLAWFLAIPLHWGTNGVWVAMSVSVGIAALIIAARFQSRAWTKLRI